ncbi:MAG TPA: glycosyltransferase family 39 protein [Acidobacteriaceae bacterium]|nr:glycosyltransferase family 39 protein [Acidobacteriaceae bacterium]
MPLDASSPRPSLASTQAHEPVAVTVNSATLPAAPHLAPEMRAATHPPRTPTSAPANHTTRTRLLILFGLWLLLYVSAAFTPPLLDDADSTHSQAAQSMLSTGDWVTLHVDGIRYLEKPPLPYWITAVSLKLLAPAHRPFVASPQAERAAAFAVHFPLALTILGLALLGYTWARRAFNQTAALITGLFLLTAAGVFLFTRIFIPDALLSLLLAFTLYAFLRSLNRGDEKLSPSAQHPYLMWIALALAVLTKGLVAIVFILATTLVFLFWTRQLPDWRRFRPFTGILLFLAIAAPWHILAGLRNTGGSDGHGFFWFYFINEHVLRFLGRRIPRDYNKLPTTLYWTLHLVWLFPWSLFAPAALITAWRNRGTLLARPAKSLSSRPEAAGRSGETRSSALTFRHQTILLLLIFSTLVLAFFSLSTNQEYYTFPVYLPLLMLLAAALTSIERSANTPTTPGAPHLASEMWVSTGSPPSASTLDPTLRRALTFTFATYTVFGLAIAAALAYGLWSSRHLPFVPDIGDLLAHRNVGDYTLSMSHFFDLTGTSFAALRLPAVLALLALLIGPGIASLLYTRRRFLSAILSIAATSSVFLIAAHIAFVRFNPMLSSVNFAETIQSLERTHQISANNIVLLYGDQAFGSSIPFYLNRRVDLVDGRTTSMLFGSTFPDAPPIFLTSADLLAQWGTGPRKLLFVPLEKRDDVDRLLGSRQIILQQTSGKALITDRPLAPGS